MSQHHHIVMQGPVSPPLTDTMGIMGPSHPVEGILYVDGGLQYRDLWEKFHRPNFSYALGDGDSYFKGASQDFDELHPSDKDHSDFALALNYLEKKMPLPFQLHLYGFWGERMDHQLALFGEINHFFLRHPENELHLKVIFYDHKNQIRAVFFQREFTFFLEEIFSLFSFQTQEIAIKGQAKYRGKITMQALSSLGISNKACGKVTVQTSGPLLAIIPQGSGPEWEEES